MRDVGGWVMLRSGGFGRACERHTFVGGVGVGGVGPMRSAKQRRMESMCMRLAMAFAKVGRDRNHVRFPDTFAGESVLVVRKPDAPLANSARHGVWIWGQCHQAIPQP